MCFKTHESRCTFSETTHARAYGTRLSLSDEFQNAIDMFSMIASPAYLLWSEPEILFYSKRRSATGYIYTYPLMEEPPFATAMQKEMISEMKGLSPR